MLPYAITGVAMLAFLLLLMIYAALCISAESEIQSEADNQKLQNEKMEEDPDGNDV